MDKLLSGGLLLFSLLVSVTVTAENIVEGDVVITDEMFAEELELLPEEARDKYLTSLKTASVMIDDLYKRKKLLDEALRRGLDKDPLYAKRVEKARKQLLVMALDRQIRESIAYPDFEPLAKQEYLANKDKYMTKPRVRVRHILIGKKPGQDPAESRKKIEEILARVKKGESFEELAREFSEDPAVSKNGGDIGWFGYGKTVKPFETAAFALQKPGDLSDIVETRYGYHILQLIAAKPSVVKEYDTVKEEIMAELKKKYLATEVSRIYAEIENPEHGKMNAEALDRAYQKALSKYRHSQ